MKLTTKQFDETAKELREIMKAEVVNKLHSHIYSLQRENENLKKSRDEWKSKYLKLKEVKNGTDK